MTSTAVTQAQAHEIESAPELYRGILRQSYRAVASPRTAIKAFCLHCTGYQRIEVRNCTCERCPLHKYRPYQVAAAADEESPS